MESYEGCPSDGSGSPYWAEKGGQCVSTHHQGHARGEDYEVSGVDLETFQDTEKRSPRHSLQKFKLNIANTVVNEQNSGLESMNTDQVLDLFNAETGEAERLNGPAKEGGAMTRNQILDVWVSPEPSLSCKLIHCHAHQVARSSSGGGIREPLARQLFVQTLMAVATQHCML